MRIELGDVDLFAFVVGVGVILLALSLARSPRKLGSVIHDYYANLARRKRNWWGPLSWQQAPGERTSVGLAWILIGATLAMGAYFVFLAFADI